MNRVFDSEVGFPAEFGVGAGWVGPDSSEIAGTAVGNGIWNFVAGDFAEGID